MDLCQEGGRCCRDDGNYAWANADMELIKLNSSKKRKKKELFC